MQQSRGSKPKPSQPVFTIRLKGHFASTGALRIKLNRKLVNPRRQRPTMAARPGADMGEAGLVIPSPTGPDSGGGWWEASLSRAS